MTQTLTSALSSSAPFLLPFIPTLLVSAMIAVIAYLLAREKGRNVAVWTILGAVPFVNFICVWFFIGASNLRLERKIDQLLHDRGRGGAREQGSPLNT
jgi:amino acid permease